MFMWAASPLTRQPKRIALERENYRLAARKKEGGGNTEFHFVKPAGASESVVPATDFHALLQSQDLARVDDRQYLPAWS